MADAPEDLVTFERESRVVVAPTAGAATPAPSSSLLADEAAAAEAAAAAAVAGADAVRAVAAVDDVPSGGQQVRRAEPRASPSLCSLSKTDARPSFPATAPRDHRSSASS